MVDLAVFDHKVRGSSLDKNSPLGKLQEFARRWGEQQEDGRRTRAAILTQRLRRHGYAGTLFGGGKKVDRRDRPIIVPAADAGGIRRRKPQWKERLCVADGSESRGELLDGSKKNIGIPIRVSQWLMGSVGRSPDLEEDDNDQSGDEG
jgi:hypothetical protein